MKLPSGPLFIVEEMPWLQSASIGFFMPCGSGNEPQELSGITHFIEHLIFKGTKTKTPRDIALAFEGVGGILNASTSKELLNVYGKISTKYLKRGFSVIADMFLNPRFLEQDIDREKGVIHEEIRMSIDLPDMFLFEKFSRQVWGKSTLAKPITGTIESLHKLTRRDILKWYSRNFIPDNLIISISGNVQTDEIPAWWNHLAGTRHKAEPVNGKVNGYEIKPIRPPWINGVKVYRRDIEQALVVIGFPAPSVRDPERYPYSMIESILGGGMGARLFQQIREKSGLVYDIEIGFSPMRATGVMTIDSQTKPAVLFKLIDRILGELNKLKSKPVIKSELTRVKDFIEGSTFLGMESSSNRMYRNALSQMFQGKIVPVGSVVERLHSVTEKEIIQTANRFFTSDKIACAVLVPENWKSDREITAKISELISKNLAD
jgi:predicted Zn-dependent peptidase